MAPVRRWCVRIVKVQPREERPMAAWVKPVNRVAGDVLTPLDVVHRRFAITRQVEAIEVESKPWFVPSESGRMSQRMRRSDSRGA